MRVYKLIRAEARAQMSSQDRPETAAAASAPAREPKTQTAEPSGGVVANSTSGPAESASAQARGPRHARRRHRSGGGGSGSDTRGGGEGRELQPRQLERELNLDELRELSELIIEQGFTEFELEREGFRVRISRQAALLPQAHTGVQPFVPPTITPIAPPTITGSTPASATPAPAVAEATASADDELHKITSPIVGTFYRSPSPTAESFVRAGSHVEADTVVCIIEAMKLMNEIQAEVSGTVEKIYVENGQPVEYGQALFGIRK